MSSPSFASLPKLGVADFGPGMDHVAEAYHNGRVFAIVHKSDLARQVIPNLRFAMDDPYTYIFLHGGPMVTRFENKAAGTYEIPEDVVAHFLTQQYGSQLEGMSIRMCTCYGNLLRPRDSRTVVQALAGLLPKTSFEGYHGLVILDVLPPNIRLGLAVHWDSTSVPPGPVVVGPPGPWEHITP
jgi:hypothetical protein